MCEEPATTILLAPAHGPRLFRSAYFCEPHADQIIAIAERNQMVRETAPWN